MHVSSRARNKIIDLKKEGTESLTISVMIYLYFTIASFYDENTSLLFLRLPSPSLRKLLLALRMRTSNIYGRKHRQSFFFFFNLTLSFRHGYTLTSRELTCYEYPLIFGLLLRKYAEEALFFFSFFVLLDDDHATHPLLSSISNNNQIKYRNQISKYNNLHRQRNNINLAI